MKSINRFLMSECGAVTVDWVVLTGGLVGLGLATMAVVTGGVEDNSQGVSDTMETYEIATSFASSLPSTVAYSGNTAADYYAYGAGLAPGNNGATYAWAHDAASQDAPDGYNFDNPLVDTGTGDVVYTSDDGQSYAVGGTVYSIDDYPGEAVYWGA